jgi:Fur family peroxide stress response transcriptional regulator
MKNTRMTNQRLKIMEYLKSVKTHPTAEMVYNKVVKELPKITLATVYRNLNLLADQGEILRLEINNEYRYDADLSFHQHCVCKKCGKIIDLFQKEISRYALNKIRTNNFKPTSVNVIFYGICKKCKKI